MYLNVVFVVCVFVCIRAIFVGVGDFSSQRFDMIGYKQSSLDVYNDISMPTVTGQPYIDSTCYVDKHPQPSGDGPSGTLPTALKDFVGKINPENSRTIVQYHQTGDVHIAVYDYGQREMHVSIGRINHNGLYGPELEPESEQNEWKAYNRPYVNFNLDDLWNGI